MRQNILNWNCFLECFQAVIALGRFQNCNLLEMDHFRQYGVEDESDRGSAPRFFAGSVGCGPYRRAPTVESPGTPARWGAFCRGSGGCPDRSAPSAAASSPAIRA